MKTQKIKKTKRSKYNAKKTQATNLKKPWLKALKEAGLDNEDACD